MSLNMTLPERMDSDQNSIKNFRVFRKGPFSSHLSSLIQSQYKGKKFLNLVQYLAETVVRIHLFHRKIEFSF